MICLLNQAGLNWIPVYVVDLLLPEFAREYGFRMATGLPKTSLAIFARFIAQGLCETGRRMFRAIICQSASCEFTKVCYRLLKAFAVKFFIEGGKV